MGNNCLFRRVIQLGGLLLIGNGVMGLIRPRWHSLAWHFGPELAKAATEELAEYPTVARPVYLAQAALGVALVTMGGPEED